MPETATVKTVIAALEADGFRRGVSDPPEKAQPGYAVIANRPGDGIVLVNWHGHDEGKRLLMLGRYAEALNAAGYSAKLAHADAYLMVQARNTETRAGSPDSLAAALDAIRERSRWTSSATEIAAPGANALDSARDVPRLLSAVDAAIRLHSPDPDNPRWCRGCGRFYPCETVRAITSGLTGEDSAP